MHMQPWSRRPTVSTGLPLQPALRRIRITSLVPAVLVLPELPETAQQHLTQTEVYLKTCRSPKVKSRYPVSLAKAIKSPPVEAQRHRADGSSYHPPPSQVTDLVSCSHAVHVASVIIPTSAALASLATLHELPERHQWAVLSLSAEASAQKAVSVAKLK